VGLRGGYGQVIKASQVSKAAAVTGDGSGEDAARDGEGAARGGEGAARGGRSARRLGSPYGWQVPSAVSGPIA
jgi:hypothetical protein